MVNDFKSLEGNHQSECRTGDGCVRMMSLCAHDIIHFSVCLYIK